MCQEDEDWAFNSRCHARLLKRKYLKEYFALMYFAINLSTTSRKIVNLKTIFLKKGYSRRELKSIQRLALYEIDIVSSVENININLQKSIKIFPICKGKMTYFPIVTSFLFLLA